MDSLYLVSLYEYNNIRSIRAKIVNIDSEEILYYSIKELSLMLRDNKIYLENCIYDEADFIKITIGNYSDYLIYDSDRVQQKKENIILVEEIHNSNGNITGYKYCTSSGKVFEESKERLVKLFKQYHFINAIADSKNTFKVVGKKLKIHTKYNIETCYRIVAKRLENLANSIEKDEELSSRVLRYSVLRNIVVDAANKGFKSLDKGYKLNQGIYKHKDGSTTLIDLDGFFVDCERNIYTTDIVQCLKELANYIEKYANGEALPLKGITDSQYKIEHLATCNVKQFIESELIPITIVYKTDKDGLNALGSNICSNILLKPLYNSEVELSYILNEVYNEVYTKAKKCKL